uniref:Apple domain-containing protein n=1 Tax=Acrobeloides nanus TaxID=290746 RepID=A0A914D5T8_9BILA
MDIFKSVLLFQLVLYLISTALAQNSSCSYKEFPGYGIDGSDIGGVPGRTTDCCALCQKNPYCVAYTWEPYDGGMCWLKNDTGPMSKDSISGTLSGFVSPGPKQTYSLIKKYAAPNFFDDWWFDTRDGKAFGFASNADNKTAWDKGLVGYQNGKVYIGVDHTTTIPNNTWGRLSPRISSLQLYNAGFFVLSLDHVPVGPYANGSGWHSSPVWSMFMMTGDQASNGEFDFYKAHNPVDVANSMIYNNDEALYGKCSLPWDPKKYANISGWADNELMQEGPHGTSDVPFNKAGGGVYAAQWVHGSFIKVWYFVKPNIPADILNENPNPNPGTWGTPNGYYVFGDNCNPEVVNNNYLVLYIAFCNPPVTQECQDIMRNNPSNFQDTYFLIDYLKVFCRPGENCWSGNYTLSGQ